MQAKTKWITTLASLCAVLVVAIVSMGIVWAATSQSVQTSIRVTYSVSDVVCDVSANKYFHTDSPTAFTGGTNGVISFNAPDASDTRTLTTTATTLNSAATDQYVIYEYIITNKSSEAMNAALVTTVTDEDNTNLTFYVSAPSATRKTNVVSTFDPSSGWTAGNSIAATTIAAAPAPTAATPEYTTTYAYVAIKVTNTNITASFTGAFTWTLQNGAAA